MQKTVPILAAPRITNVITDTETALAQPEMLEALEGGISKAWRGYYLVVIADQATGHALVWTVIDAATDEVAAIVGLLSDLYRLWPDCPAYCIAGDSAFDEDPWCRLAEVDYAHRPARGPRNPAQRILLAHLAKKSSKPRDRSQLRGGWVGPLTSDTRVCFSSPDNIV